MTNPKVHHDKHYTGIVLHAIYSIQTICQLRCVYKLRRVIASRESSSIHYIQHREVREDNISGSVGKLSSKCFHKNSVPDKRFESEVTPSHIHSSVDIHVFWRSPRTGTKCITFAVSPSCLPIFKSDERETVNVAAKNDNTS